MTLDGAYARLAAAGVDSRLAVELGDCWPPPGQQHAPCAWCSGPGVVSVALELVPISDESDDAEFDSAEVERVLCGQCVGRYAPKAMLAMARFAGRTVPDEALPELRRTFAGLLARLGASLVLTESAVFVVLVSPTIVEG